MLNFKDSQPTIYWVAKIPEVEFVALLGDTVVAASVDAIYLLDHESGHIKHNFMRRATVFIFVSNLPFLLRDLGRRSGFEAHGTAMYLFR
jgi:hypothetical protein